MTTKEYIKHIQALSPEKIQIISESLHEALLLINKAECQLFDTPLRDIEIPVLKNKSLWYSVYRSYKLFENCLTPKP